MMFKIRALMFSTFLLLSSLSIHSQNSDSLTIKLHFLYGSKPKHNTKDVEKKLFGGIHGGHASIEIENVVFGFSPKGSYHIFSHNNNPHGGWQSEPLKYWVKDTVDEKYTSFIIPVTREQYDSVKSILTQYMQETPYDYAFFLDIAVQQPLGMCYHKPEFWMNIQKHGKFTVALFQSPNEIKCSEELKTLTPRLFDTMAEILENGKRIGGSFVN